MLVLLAGACRGGAGDGDSSPVRQYTVAEFYENVTYSGASFSADKSRILVTSDLSGVFNAYAISSGGGDPVPLTSSTSNAVFAVSYFPEDDRILYASDEGGNELSHLYVRELDGTTRDLTPGAKVRAEFHGWAHDLKSFFVATNERDPRYFDLYEYGVYQYKRRLVYRNTTGYDYGPVSRDKRYLALVRHHATTDADVWVYEIPTRATKLLTKHDGRARFDPQDFTPDSRSLLVTTDEGRDFLALRAYDIAAGTSSVLLAPSWDVERAAFSYHGKYLTARINEDSRPSVRVYDAATMNEDSIPGLPEGLIASMVFSRDDKTYAAYAGDGRAPPDLFTANVGFNARRLTSTLSGDIRREDLVTPEVVHFRAPDSVDIPGVLYRPRAATAKTKAPALVMVHGGPGGQATVRYSALIQALANHGYVVFDVNNRGSSGYGRKFLAMDDRRHGEADLADVVAAKDMLIGTGVVDSARIGIIGGSYGGYMVLAALTLRPDEFRTGVDLFGISNWVRTLESIPPWWGAMRTALYDEMGDPATDAARLRRISPLFHAERLRAPLMVLQGANDPRVLQVESDDIVAAAKKNGVPVEYIVFPDEGHGFVKKRNEIRGYSAVLAFLDRYLKGVAAAQ